MVVGFSRKSALTALFYNGFRCSLSSFVSDWKRAQKEKESQRRHEVLRQQSALVEAGMPTPALVNILRDIFANYLSDEESCLGYVEACRLWYRCGLKLSSLREIFDSKLSDDGGRKEIEFYDYLALIQRIIAEDSKHFSQSPANEIVAMGFEIGEKVELVEGYERFGDAANGPLQPVDRGTVIELQKASSGEMYVCVIAIDLLRCNFSSILTYLLLFEQNIRPCSP